MIQLYENRAAKLAVCAMSSADMSFASPTIIMDARQASITAGNLVFERLIQIAYYRRKDRAKRIHFISVAGVTRNVQQFVLP